MINICRWFFLGLYNVFTLIPRYLFIGLICLINPKRGREITIKGKRVIPIMMISMTLSVYFICIFFSTRWYVQRLKIKELSNDILESTKILEDELPEVIDKTEYNPEHNDKYSNISFLSVDFSDLKRKNNDTVAWIKVNNTNVNYSVVQTKDNEYYLNHDFNKKSNFSGWVYGDYRDDFTYFGNNTILYAHNLINRSMFGSLIWCQKESWYTNTDNQYIKISTPTSNTIWHIFSIYQIKPEVYYLKTYFETTEEHQDFLDTLKSRSIYNFNEELSTTDKILTLSTCSDDGTKRAVIHAKMVKAEYR